MDLISERITQFNMAINDFMKGKLTAEKAQILVALSNAQHKWVSSAITVYGMEKKGKADLKLMKRLEIKNIYNETSAIDHGLGDPEVDKVKCPYHDDLITRAECLDYSGHHYDDCSGCEIGKATKDKLLPQQ